MSREFIEPNLAWSLSAPQGVKGADFRRIEGNTKHLFDKINRMAVLSGRFTFDGSNANVLNLPAWNILQSTTVYMSPGSKLRLLQAAWRVYGSNLTGVNLRLMVTADFRIDTDGILHAIDPQQWDSDDLLGPIGRSTDSGLVTGFGSYVGPFEIPIETHVTDTLVVEIVAGVAKESELSASVNPISGYHALLSVEV
jgi:hypothetical protein